MWVKDLKRTIDYLETRPETFDTNKLAFEGLSWGGMWAGVYPAIDRRIKVVVSLAGGLGGLDWPPEYSQLNFAPRIERPILLEGGRYDSVFPLETSQKPLLKLFRTAEQDKHHKIYDTGHGIWSRNQPAKDEVDFLNRYLGPVK
jgi:dienelactone hydrolase